MTSFIQGNYAALYGSPSYQTRTRLINRCQLLSVLLTLLLIPAVVPTSTVADDTPLYILNLYTLHSDGSPISSRILTDGLQAALKANNASASTGSRAITLINPSDSTLSPAAAIEAALSQYPDILAIIGPQSDELLNETVAYLGQRAPSLTALAPFTVKSLGRDPWSPQKYFTRASTVTELLTIIADVVSVTRVKRIGTVVDKGQNFDQAAYSALKKGLNDIHKFTPIEYSQGSSDKSLNTANFNAYMESSTGPQAIVILGGDPDNWTKEFVLACYREYPTIPLYFISDGYHLLYEVLQVEPTFSFYFTTTNLLPATPAYRHIQLFEEEMISYIQTGDSFFSSYDSLNSTFLSSLTVFGWISGKILIQSLSDPSAITNSATYQSWLFNQRQYSIDEDLLIGPFGGVCSAYEKITSATCKCNDGGHMAHVYQVTGSASTAGTSGTATNPIVLRSTFTIPRSKCNAAGYVIPFYAVDSVFFYQGIHRLINYAQLLLSSATTALEDQNKDQSYLVTSGVDITDKADVLEFNTTYLVDIIMGPVIGIRNVSLSLPYVAFVDPVDEYPVPRIASPMVVYLMPTLDQQIYVAASLSSKRGYALGVMLRSSVEETAIRQIINNAAEFHNIRIDVFSLETEEKEITAEHIDVMLLIGVTHSDLNPIRSMLEAKSSWYMCMLYEEFSLLYDEVLQTFANATTSVTQRLLTQTNLPLWTDFSSETAAEYPTLSDYHEAYSTVQDVNPATLQMWYTAGVLKQMMNSRYNDDASSLQDALYYFSSYTYGALEFDLEWDESVCGSSDATTTISTATSIECVNYGATQISMISLSRVLQPANSSVFYGPVDALVAIAGSGGPNQNVILAVAFPLAVVIFVLFGLLLYLCFWKNSRDNANAPKDEKKPVTLMFTDIQSSTSLWAAYPEEMVAAMDAHHSIIRSQITKYGCYEVKTIGDSFMVASENAVTMVELAIAIQKALLSYDWGTFCFDKFYLQSEAAARTKQKIIESSSREEELENSGEAIGGKRLSVLGSQCAEESVPDGYSSQWNGLRVRIGMHTGLCDIRLDETSKGYDYYGDTVNTAARTESTASGGQILITQRTWEALCEESHARDKVEVNDAGCFMLRGVPHPVQMYCVAAVPGRVCGKTARDDESSEEEEDVEDYASCSAGGTSVGNFSHRLSEVVYLVFTGLLSPFPAKKKLDYIEPLLKKWRVPTRKDPELKKDLTDRQRFVILAHRLANRTGRIISRQMTSSSKNNNELKAGGGSLSFGLSRDACGPLGSLPSGASSWQRQLRAWASLEAHESQSSVVAPVSGNRSSARIGGVGVPSGNSSQRPSVTAQQQHHPLSPYGSGRGGGWIPSGVVDYPQGQASPLLRSPSSHNEGPFFELSPSGPVFRMGSETSMRAGVVQQNSGRPAMPNGILQINSSLSSVEKMPSKTGSPFLCSAAVPFYPSTFPPSPPENRQVQHHHHHHHLTSLGANNNNNNNNGNNNNTARQTSVRFTDSGLHPPSSGGTAVTGMSTTGSTVDTRALSPPHPIHLVTTDSTYVPVGQSPVDRDGSGVESVGVVETWTGGSSIPLTARPTTSERTFPPMTDPDVTALPSGADDEEPLQRPVSSRAGRQHNPLSISPRHTPSPVVVQDLRSLECSELAPATGESHGADQKDENYHSAEEEMERETETEAEHVMMQTMMWSSRDGAHIPFRRGRMDSVDEPRRYSIAHSDRLLEVEGEGEVAEGHPSIAMETEKKEGVSGEQTETTTTAGDPALSSSGHPASRQASSPLSCLTDSHRKFAPPFLLRKCDDGSDLVSVERSRPVASSRANTTSRPLTSPSNPLQPSLAEYRLDGVLGGSPKAST